MPEFLAAAFTIGVFGPVLALVLLAIRRLWSRMRLVDDRRGRGRPPRGGDAGDREPRRPRPFAGAGAVALDLPEEDMLEDVG